MEDKSAASSSGVFEGAKAGGGEAVEDGAGTCPDEASFTVWVSLELGEDVEGKGDGSSETAELVV